MAVEGIAKGGDNKGREVSEERSQQCMVSQMG